MLNTKNWVLIEFYLNSKHLSRLQGFGGTDKITAYR